MSNGPEHLRSDEEMARAMVSAPVVHDAPIVLVEYDPMWPSMFETEAARLRSLLGATVVRLEHVGSTSVPGLAAKPIIDMLLVVPDPDEEDAYVAPLTNAGYVLKIREPDWWRHRMFKGPSVDINLHVFGPDGAPEFERMVTFRDHLRAHPEERDEYLRVKRELATRTWRFVQHYADAKTEVVEAILARAQRGSGDGSLP